MNYQELLLPALAALSLNREWYQAKVGNPGTARNRDPCGLRSQSGQGFRQNQRASGDVFWGCIFVGPMAVAVAARNEQHRNRRDA